VILCLIKEIEDHISVVNSDLFVSDIGCRIVLRKRRPMMAPAVFQNGVFFLSAS